MKNVIGKMNQYMILQSIISILLGLFLLLWPQATLTTIVYIFGGYMAVLALLNVISYLRNKNGNRYFNNDLISAILQGILALVLFINPRLAIGLLPFIAGLVVLLSSVLNFTRGLEIRQTTKKGWMFIVIVSILTGIFGVVLLLNPFGSAVAVVILYGIMLLVKGVSDFVTYMIYYVSDRKN